MTILKIQIQIQIILTILLGIVSQMGKTGNTDDERMSDVLLDLIKKAQNKM